jgi:hypothetical protein
MQHHILRRGAEQTPRGHSMRGNSSAKLGIFAGSSRS